jgi:RNA polymerase sigma-70 factor (ECF subfamily)
VHRYLHRRVGSDLADELASETFGRAFSRRATFEPCRESALPWLYGIATNLLRRHWRSEVRQLRAYGRLARDDVAELDQDAVAEQLDAAARSATLARALASLPGKERDTLCLIALAGLTHDETAAALGVPPGTVASRLHSARARLRPLLGDDNREAQEDAT